MYIRREAAQLDFCEDYMLHCGSEANKSCAGFLGGIRVWKLHRSLPASPRSPDRLWQSELRANRLDNKCPRQPYKLRMTYDEVLWSERQDRKYQDLICQTSNDGNEFLRLGRTPCQDLENSCSEDPARRPPKTHGASIYRIRRAPPVLLRESPLRFYVLFTRYFFGRGSDHNFHVHFKL